MTAPMNFTPPNLVDRTVNRAFGLLLKLGIGLKHNYLLEVRGRKTGKIHATPVNVLEYKSKKYLVAPRGYTQWVRNVDAGGESALVRGGRREAIKPRSVAEASKAEILKVYLDCFRLTVQRYFPVPAGSPVEVFEPLKGRYPVFEVAGNG